MELGCRIKVILDEQKVKQVDFAKALGISANYVNLLVNNKKSTISDTLAKLMEETYGYSSEWIISGNGERKISNGNLTAVRAEVVKKISRMSDSDVKAILAYAKTLESVNVEFSVNDLNKQHLSIPDDEVQLFNELMPKQQKKIKQNVEACQNELTNVESTIHACAGKKEFSDEIPPEKQKEIDEEVNSYRQIGRAHV